MCLKLTNKIAQLSVLKPACLLMLLHAIPFLSWSQQDSTGFPQGRSSPVIYADTSASSYNPGRVKLVAGLNIAAYGGSLLVLNEAWYKGHARTSFHTFNDSREWQQVDKVGHTWSAYSLGKYSADVWQWAGLPHKKAVWIGGLSGAGYLTVIELLDAHSARWGWSWADMGANVIGSGLFISQELIWNEQRVQFKFSSHKKSYDASVRQRADDLFGSSFSEQVLKDYNGQTYWISINLKSFFPSSNLPSWLNIAGGYGAEGMLGGFENKWTNTDGSTVTRYDIPRRRQFYIAPDIDLTKIRTRKKGVRTVLNILNSIKIPAPALEFSGKKLKAHWLYF